MSLLLERLSIDGPVGVLEAVVEDPQVGAAHFAVLCHPHPQFGGTMDNKVVTTLARALHDCTIPTVRFNYRGVGASGGGYDAGRGESEDAMRVADWAQLRWPGRTLIAAGFSFGGMVALRLALARDAARLITVAPAIQRFAPDTRTPHCPWLIVQGDADDVVDPQAVLAWAGTLKPPHACWWRRGWGTSSTGTSRSCAKPWSLTFGTAEPVPAEPNTPIGLSSRIP